jgi:hypothetical protein
MNPPHAPTPNGSSRALARWQAFGANLWGKIMPGKSKVGRDDDDDDNDDLPRPNATVPTRLLRPFFATAAAV